MATTIPHSKWGRKLRAAAGGVLGLALIAYVMAKGISILAGMVGPGPWGYLGALGVLGVVGQFPFLLVSKGIGVFGRSVRLSVLAGALTFVVARVGVGQHWSGWWMAAWPAAVIVGWVVVRAILSLPVRVVRRRAARLLRRQRGTGNDDAWSLRDWEWAYTQLGTPLALDQAAWCRMLQTSGPRDPGQTGRSRRGTDC